MANSNFGLEGTALLNDPVHNRGTAFTEQERASHHLEGLLPAAVDEGTTLREAAVASGEVQADEYDRIIVPKTMIGGGLAGA
jgi:hypothetical protein